MPEEQRITRFSRDEFVKQINDQSAWDVIIIGGGATGLGVAVDSASRGYSTLLLEQADFAKGTSSRSTKLVHGGVRYLAKGDIRLVYNALDERAIMLKNASHLVKSQSFIIPCYSWFSTIKYMIGLKLYDWLSGRFSFGKSSFFNREKVIEQLPNINATGLAAGVEYFDGQFDDARLAINLAQTSAAKGGVLLNYFKVTGLHKNKGKVNGVAAIDLETKKEYKLSAKVVVNATGIFVDDVLKFDEPGRQPLVRPSQGIHLVLKKSFLKSTNAILIPETKDGRVLFAVPWHQHVLVGTTDTPLTTNSIEPVALEEEIEFILETVKTYFSVTPTRKDVLSVFAGLRPLAADNKNLNSTKEISRDHKLLTSSSGLITITGGKWTTYRKMAEETVNKAIEVGKLVKTACLTKKLKIHGCTTSFIQGHFSVYGTDAAGIKELIKDNPLLGHQLVDHLPYTEAEVVWAVRYEMARCAEDVLARRLRILFLDALAAIDAAPRVVALIAQELGYPEEWKRAEVATFHQLAYQYLPDLKAGFNGEHNNRNQQPTDGQIHSFN
ncbi:glycerol-3-phosphate dehydrogenase/oxidase [Segetibacter sp.]|jgi:glycerol-3-phosphate dehydrogenase|uniref:glycerol-3-phosphate dehydrogenase/oxidase n=1 Tax=Segetibacter sp. TaxID=2231182 RepID=UPI002624945E|nr:glycerol-3-phosphate dehydrogenase/oxidase [Segetibacter sp.]MCW3079678.1 glycerol-3-phosphate dehydrogenase/oxidase [Segetibacter sp.]